MKRDDFRRYVDMAMAGRGMDAIRPVVEKELLHYEIFNALESEGLLNHLVFQGGTALRLCRGSDRFSEDLDFAGGRNFTADKAHAIKDCVTKRVADRFGLDVNVREPGATNKPTQNVHVDKWTVSVETNPGRPDLPRQKIKLEIANVPAYTREVVPLRLNYPVLEGMNTPLVATESIHEILADKVVALPTSIAKITENGVIDTPSRIRYRDIWDIAWLIRQGAELPPQMVLNKVADYGIAQFPALLEHAMRQVPEIAAGRDFRLQMSRFVERSRHESLFGMPGSADYFSRSVNDVLGNALNYLEKNTSERKGIEHAIPDHRAHPARLEAHVREPDGTMRSVALWADKEGNLQGMLATSRADEDPERHEVKFTEKPSRNGKLMLQAAAEMEDKSHLIVSLMPSEAKNSIMASFAERLPSGEKLVRIEGKGGILEPNQAVLAQGAKNRTIQAVQAKLGVNVLVNVRTNQHNKGIGR